MAVNYRVATLQAVISPENSICYSLTSLTYWMYANYRATNLAMHESSSRLQRETCRIHRSLRNLCSATKNAATCRQIVFRCGRMSHIRLLKKGLFKVLSKSSSVWWALAAKLNSRFFFHKRIVSLTSLRVDFKIFESRLRFNISFPFF